MSNSTIRQAAEALAQARSVAILTGAGVSAESGVATFRGTDGIWSKMKPEELASFDAFLRNPALVWEWYLHRKKLITETKPNPAHYALARLEELVPDYTLITQNIDDLHRRAGSRNILELHGNITRSFCIDCGKQTGDVALGEMGELPKCVYCGGLIRPDVVWFGEILPQDALDGADRAARRAEVFIVAGTSNVVYPAALLPRTAKLNGATVIECNIEHTPLSEYADFILEGKAGDTLPQLVAMIERTMAR